MGGAAALSPETQNILGICVMALGIVYCFFGYRFFRIALFSTGFMGFSLACTYVSYLIFPRSDAPAVIAALVGGLAGGVLFYFVHMIGVLVIGGSFGVLVGIAVTAMSGRDIQPLLLGILGVVAGSLAVIIKKHVIILATAFGGAGAITVGSWYLAKNIDPAALIQDPSSLGREFHAILACWFIGSVVGLVLQYTVTGKPKELEEEEEEPKEVKDVKGARPRTATRPKTGSGKTPRQPTQKRQKPKTQQKPPQKERQPTEDGKPTTEVAPAPEPRPEQKPATPKSTLPPLRPAPSKSEEEEYEEY